MRWRSGTLDDLYFEWLYAEVAPLEVLNPVDTYWNLLRELYSLEFLYFVPNDDNRAMDGLELREEFLRMENVEGDPYWDTLPCSIFEMLVALARRAEFEGGFETEYWFWLFIRNLGLDIFSDEFCDRNSSGWRMMVDITQTAVNTLNERLYSHSGHDGGLFPLIYPEEDQRHMEIWYQMAAYLREEG